MTRKEVFCEEYRQWDENADHQSKDKREGCGPDHGPLETCSVRFCTRLVNGKYAPPVGLAGYLNGSSGQLFIGALVDRTSLTYLFGMFSNVDVNRGSAAEIKNTKGMTTNVSC